MNLQITGTAYDGTSVTLKNPLSLSFHAKLTCPYDELTISFLPVEKQIKTLSVSVDGSPFFDGMVVTQTLEQRISPASKFLCQSRPGYLLEENQLSPYAYFRVSGQSIIDRFARPFGVAGVRLSEDKTINIMLVSEKESYWDFLTAFYVQAYGVPPYIRRDKYIELTPYTGRSYLFSPTRAGALRYLDYKEHFHSKLISKISFYTGEDDFGSLYEESFVNPLSSYVGYPKGLFLNPTRSWVTEHKKYADYLFYKSMVDSRAVEVTLPGWHDFEPGDSVYFDRGDGSNEHLYIGESRIVTGKEGITTIVRLWDPARNPLL